jgi:hypothetical protein
MRLSKTVSTLTLLTVVAVSATALAACSPQPTVTSDPATGLPAATAPSDVETTVSDVYGTDVSQVLIGSEINVPDTNVSLMLGEGVQDFNQGMDRGDVMWGDLFVAHPVADGIDVIGYVNVNHGGSGTQQYLVLYHVTPDSKTHTSSVMIGDRIPVERIEILNGATLDEYVVAVSYLTRGPDEPMVNAPTIPQTDQFVVTQHEFQTPPSL